MYCSARPKEVSQQGRHSTAHSAFLVPLFEMDPVFAFHVHRQTDNVRDALVRVKCENSPCALRGTQIATPLPFCDLVVDRGIQSDVIGGGVGAFEDVFIKVLEKVHAARELDISMPIPQLQPAQGPGIQSEEESVPLAQEVIDLDPSGPRSSKAHLGKAPFKAPRVGLKEKDRSETDVKAAHALKAQKLSAASAKSSLDALRAADAAPASPKSPFLLFAGQKQAAATAVPASPKPSPRKEPPSSEPCTPTQVIESDDSCFREVAAGGAAT